MDFASGHEPLLSLDLYADALEHCRKQERRTSKTLDAAWVTTNGTVLTDKAHDFLETHDVRLGFSIDGPADIHDPIRCDKRGEPTHDRAVAAAREFLQDHDADVSATLTSWRPEAKRIFLHLYETGFERIVLRPVHVPGGHTLALNMAAARQLAASYKELVDFLVSQEEGSLVSYLYHMPQGDYLGRFIERVVQGARVAYRCGAGKWYVAVDMAGDIYPCIFFAGQRQFKVGSIGSGLDYDKVRLFSESLAVHRRPRCRDCWARWLCGGGCYYNSLVAMGGLEKVDPAECYLNKRLIEIAVYFVARLSEAHPQAFAFLQERCNPAPRGSKLLPGVSFPMADAEAPGKAVWEAVETVRLRYADPFYWHPPKGEPKPHIVAAFASALWEPSTLHLRLALPTSHGTENLSSHWREVLSGRAGELELSVTPPWPLDAKPSTSVLRWGNGGHRIGSLRRRDGQVFLSLPWAEFSLRPLKPGCRLSVGLRPVQEVREGRKRSSLTAHFLLTGHGRDMRR